MHHLMHHDEILLMPKKAKELSALAVSKLKADAEYYVGGAEWEPASIKQVKQFPAALTWG